MPRTEALFELRRTPHTHYTSTHLDWRTVPPPELGWFGCMSYGEWWNWSIWNWSAPDTSNWLDDCKTLHLTLSSCDPNSISVVGRIESVEGFSSIFTSFLGPVSLNETLSVSCIGIFVDSSDTGRRTKVYCLVIPFLSMLSIILSFDLDLLRETTDLKSYMIKGSISRYG